MSAFARALRAFRLQTPTEVQADMDALHARVVGNLDQLQREANAVFGRMRATGVLPDRRKHPRQEIAR